MSDKEPPRNVAGGGGGGGGGGCDDEDDPEEKKRKGLGEKDKRMSFFKWRKGKKLQNQGRKDKGISVNFGCLGRSGVGGCFVCLKEPRTMDSLGESPTSDPNSSEFTFDMLRALIEKNEFNSRDCNPHLDADG